LVLQKISSKFHQIISRFSFKFFCFILRAIKSVDLAKYVGTHYKAPRMVLAAAGGINHDQLVRLSEEHFGKLKAGYQGEVPDLLPCR
jgi:hypothetical protein